MAEPSADARPPEPWQRSMQEHPVTVRDLWVISKYDPLVHRFLMGWSSGEFPTFEQALVALAYHQALKQSHLDQDPNYSSMRSGLYPGIRP